MAYDNAVEVKKAKNAYRKTLWLARAAAIKLAMKLMEEANKDGAEIPREALQAMTEVLKEAREVFLAEPKIDKSPKNKPGQAVDGESALRSLEALGGESKNSGGNQ